MVQKKEHGEVSWLFPECFDYLLDSQQDDGTWTCYASHVDGILNTLAALLSLAKHSRLTQVGPHEEISMFWRIDKARSGLQALLQTWNVDETVHVGFEILVPSLLRQVELLGIHLEFPGCERLLQLYTRKMENLKPALLYSKKQTTLLHSLEAFVGLIEFDNVSHHCSKEVGILGSPAATAAYLMNASQWDERAEMYLKSTVSAYANRGVPNAFPTCIFEISWALSTLLSHVDFLKDLEVQDAMMVSSFLSKTLEKQNGLVGFAPGILEDADDTARTLVALQRLGKRVDPGPMIDKFESDDHFMTYELERNSSFSANSNVLLALLEFQPVDEHLPQIEKTITFLLQEWGESRISDKWNLAPEYSLMLFSGALVRLLERWDIGDLQQLPTNIVQQQVPAVLCQILSQILSGQNEDGSWAASREVTAYSILTIAQCRSLPWCLELRDCLGDRLLRGRGFLKIQQTRPLKNDYLWVEKTTYGSALLRMVYCLSALHRQHDQRIWNQTIIDCFSKPGKRSKEMRSMFSKLPLLKQSPLISMDLVLVEAAHFAERLKEAKFTIFQKGEMLMTKDEYLEFIPTIWVACNQIGGCALSANAIWSMLLLSLLIYQIDELMESVIIHLSDSRLRVLVSHIVDECGLNSDLVCEDALQVTHLNLKYPPDAGKVSQNSRNHSSSDSQHRAVSVESVIEIITRFVRHVLKDPAVLQSPRRMQKELAIELHNFLLAHINRNLAKISSLKGEQKHSNGHPSATLSESNYFKWVHSVASDDTSCPFAFQFFGCLISKPGVSCFEGPQAQYFSQSLTRHLATMCRQYNDYGSAARDAEEGNLNSLNFPEFSRGSKEHVTERNGIANGKSKNNGRVILTQSSHSPKDVKNDLMAIAEFERTCMQLALQNLTRMVPSPCTMKALEVFIDVTDLFGQIYVLKDLSNKVEMRAEGGESIKKERCKN
ncbi:MAG: hypothetical protein MMC33_001551 [Icmadophila ericetorum]|nr:hypothetical protein [Icmadophila ericetorum]